MERECRMWRGGKKKHRLVYGKADTGNTLRKTPKASPAEADFLFEIDPEPAAERLTSYGGAPLLIRTLRSLEVGQSVARHIKIKQRQRGYEEATFVESFVLLNGVGGDCLDDFEPLRADGGLAEMLGHAIPSPEAARNFLYEFPSAEHIETAKPCPIRRSTQLEFLTRTTI